MGLPRRAARAASPPLLAIALGSACTQDFDRFDPSPGAVEGGGDASADGATPDAASAIEGGADGGGDACAATASGCLGQARDCGDRCRSDQAACEDRCPQGRPGRDCKDACGRATATCRDACVTTCAACAGACAAQRDCDGAAGKL